ncbi:protein arginine N-methyltransferase Sfm1p [Monosporozyma servazzii]
MLYVIEHMEDGFSEWVKLEYAQIIRDVGAENLVLVSVSNELKEADLPQELIKMGLQWTHSGLECIVDEFPHLNLPPMKAGNVCLLDPRATEDLAPADASQFEYLLFGGILGDHPPRDRTTELKTLHPGLLIGKRLGDKQMSTDTAVRVAQRITNNQTPLSNIEFIDYPEFRFNKHEATEMPFRYVKDETTGQPLLPEGMLNLIKLDTQRSLEDFI